MKPCTSLTLRASIAKFLCAAGGRVRIPSDAAVRGLLFMRAVPAGKAGHIFVDSVKGTLDSRLQEGERMGVFPPMGGG